MQTVVVKETWSGDPDDVVKVEGTEVLMMVENQMSCCLQVLLLYSLLAVG